MNIGSISNGLNVGVSAATGLSILVTWVLGLMTWVLGPTTGVLGPATGVLGLVTGVPAALGVLGWESSVQLISATAGRGSSGWYKFQLFHIL